MYDEDEFDPSVLIGEELEAAVRSLGVGWSVLPGKGLVRVVRTAGFREGFAILTQIAELAESKNHHPELTLRFDEIEAALITHDKGGITAADVDMAKSIDDLIGD